MKKQGDTVAKRLTTSMKQNLKEIRKKELENAEPNDAYDIPSVKGLLARKLVEVKPYTTVRGKKIITVYLTELGKQLLGEI